MTKTSSCQPGPSVAILYTLLSHLFRESFNGYSVGQETGHQDK